MRERRAAHRRPKRLMLLEEDPLVDPRRRLAVGARLLALEFIPAAAEAAARLVRPQRLARGLDGRLARARVVQREGQPAVGPVALAQLLEARRGGEPLGTSAERVRAPEATARS